MFIEDDAPRIAPDIEFASEDALLVTARRRDDFAWIVDVELGPDPIHGLVEVYLRWDNQDARIAVSSCSNSVMHPTNFLLAKNTKNAELTVSTGGLTADCKVSCIDSKSGRAIPFDLLYDAVGEISALVLRPVVADEISGRISMTAETNGGSIIEQEIRWSRVVEDEGHATK